MPANVTTADIITQESIRETINEAIQERLVYGEVFRDLDISGIANDTIKLPQDDDRMSQPELVPENSEFPRDEEEVSTITATVKKYGLELAISMEAEEDSLFDVVDINVNKKARMMRELLNEQAHDELNANLHTNSPANDSADGALGFDDFTAGLLELRDDGYDPDLIIMGANGEKDILNNDDFNRATDLGDDIVRNGISAIGRVAGVDFIVDNSTHLQNTSDAFLIDTDEFGYFVHKGGIQTDEYEDPSTRSRVFQIWSRHVFKAEDSNAAIRIDGDA